MALRVLNMCGKDVGKHGAACTAGKLIWPMLESKLKPKMAFRVLIVTALHVQHCASHPLCANLRLRSTQALRAQRCAKAVRTRELTLRSR